MIGETVVDLHNSKRNRSVVFTDTTNENILEQKEDTLTVHTGNNILTKNISTTRNVKKICQEFKRDITNNVFSKISIGRKYEMRIGTVSISVKGANTFIVIKHFS